MNSNSKKPIKTLALAPVDAVNAAVVPKPSKREIIEAMAQVQHAREMEEWKEKTARKRGLEEEINAAMLSYIRTNIETLKPSRCSVPYSYSNGRIGEGNVSFSVTAFTEEIKRKIRAREAISVSNCPPSIDAARKMVRAKMLNFTIPLEFSDRVSALVQNAKPALEAMLSEIAKPIPAKIQQ